MRPLLLEMNAFGPFKDKVIIDFREFNQSSLFLLTGPTGSGKTTIFDAISYVLYGSASGEAREESTLKSHYATDEDLSYVRLKFIINGKTVDVYRQPKQKGPGKTKRVIDINPEFELIVDEVLISNSVKDSSKEVEQLLGLTADQFKQIVMLPQGEFRKLLTSTSTDKEAIFRNIFKTDIFKRFEQKLKEKAKRYTDENNELKIKLNRELSQIKYDHHPELDKAIKQDNYEVIITELKTLIHEDNQQLTNYTDEIMSLNKMINQLQSYIENLELLETVMEQQQRLEKLKPEISDKKDKLEFARKAKELNTLYERIENTEDKIKKSQQDLEEYHNKEKLINDNLTELKSQQEEHDKKVADIELLENKRQKLTEEKRLWDDKQKTKQEQQDKSRQIDELNQKLTKSEKDVQNLSHKLKNLKEQLLAIPVLRNELKELNDKKDALKDDLVNTKQKESQLRSAVEEKQTLLRLNEQEEKQKRNLSTLAKEAEVLSARYYANLAIVLANELEDEEPCPVCGSVEHPHLASNSDGEVDKEDLDKAQNAVDKENNALIKLQANINQIMKSISKVIDPMEISIDGIETAYAKAQHSTKEMQEEQQNLTMSSKQLEEELSKEPRLRKTVEDLNHQERQLDSERQRIESNITFMKTQIDEFNEHLKDIEHKLTTESAEQVNNQINELNNTIQTIKAKDEELKQEVNRLNTKQSTVQNSIELTNRTLDENKEELDHQRLEFNELSEKYNFETSYKDYLVEDKVADQWLREIESFNKNQIETETTLKNTIKHLPKEDERYTLEEYQRLNQEHKQTYTERSQQRDKLNVQVESNKSALVHIEELLESQQKVLEVGSLYSELSNMATGKDAMTNKISFERYVLGVYFDEILFAANHRLSQMTSGRYELERQVDNFSGRRGNGLDLEVFDQFTGKKRSVKSLSGGEMFKASLSLAFGLSDVIQNELGGVEVNTLFIDEGFGTLDSDSLDQAVQVLMELNQSGRLIGIISHVDELKARIPSKILVNKGQNGSQIELVH